MFTLVLDLDQTVIHTVETIYKGKCISDSEHEWKGSKETLIICVRPFFTEFLQEMQSLFDEIVVFSAGRPEYVNHITTLLFGHIVKNIKTWSDVKEHDDGNYSKPLAEYDKNTTYMIDDLSSNAITNDIVLPTLDNFLAIEPYVAYSDKMDTALLRANKKIKQWRRSFIK